MSNTRAAALPRHRLQWAQLDSLASGLFDRDAILTMLGVERSRRLLLLRLVRDYARQRSDATGPLPSVDDAWNLLLRAEREEPRVVEEMLADPQTGTWVGHTLRRLRDVATDEAPLWFHVGQLHAFAVAAAIRAGITDAKMRIPVWDGTVLLPSLGHLCVPVHDMWSHADVIVNAVVEIRCAGTVTKLDPRADGWFATKQFQFRALDKELSIRLDDATPYRGQDVPARPGPLASAELDRWRRLLADAWSLLVHDHPARANELAIGMSSITPIPAAFRFRPRSVSVEDGFGAAILSEPYDAAQLAVTLVHEFQHSVLNGIRHVAELVDGDDPATGYAPWRDDPRPLGGIIHGVFAFTAIAEFWAVHRHRASGVDADMANFELALWRDQTAAVLRTIRNHSALTATGARFIERIGERVDALARLTVPTYIAALSETAAVDHFAAWRACHLRPDPARTEAVADAWVSGRSAPPAPDRSPRVVQPDPLGQRLDAKAALMRIQLTDPKEFDRVRAEPRLVPGVSSADVAFVSGDLDQARRLYLEELSRTPTRAGAWSGFGLTLAAMGEPDAAEVILSEPETLRAVSTMLVAIDRPAPADELAAWLSAGAR